MNGFVRSLPLLVLAVAGLLSAQQSRGQTSVTTNPVGFNMLTLPAGNNLRVNTFVQATAFQGTAASITSASNSVVTVSATGTPLTSGSFNEVASAPVYYMEVLGTSGGMQGLIVDVVSNNGSTITVNSNLPSLGVSGTTSFCIRPHTTLSSLFPASTAALSPFLDTVELFFSNNTSQVFTFTGAGDGWLNESGSDSGSQIVYPGQGFIITVQAAKSVPVMGWVKPGPTIVPLYAGVNNLVGTINPMITGTQALSTFNFPASFVPYLDAVQVFYDTGALQSGGAFLSNGTNMITSGSGTPSDSVPVNPSNSVVVNVQQNELWTMQSFYTTGTSGQ